jgi:anthranilate synthase/aminodeoxychorismate synthase-like glutamine amidotransferase
MVLVVDNYDSFTYNLVQSLGSLGASLTVIRNDARSAAEMLALRPSRVVISPGPGRPEGAGATLAIVREAGPSVPVLGVCLGHQAIALAFGGRVVRAPRPVHGKTSVIEHDGAGLFAGLAEPFPAGRYHSLVVADEGLPPELEVTARSRGEGTIMGLRHRALPIHGVQFHPESILTAAGTDLLRNFLAM